ncbi:MAG: hypothetical protein ABT20_14775 [Rubrivivax sp. SCN 70-15]|nr:MAG: hypothetical protein ABT20_14775 [Rubrivivax sp. SCN 70-15]
MATKTVREPMFLLLLAAGTLYLLFGNLQEALTLFGLVLVTLDLTLFQEGQTGHAIEALRDPTSPRALVVVNLAPMMFSNRSGTSSPWATLRTPNPMLSGGRRARARAARRVDPARASLASRRCRHGNWPLRVRPACSGSRWSNGGAARRASANGERKIRMHDPCAEARRDHGVAADV